MRKYNILFVEHVCYDVWDQQCFCCYKFTVTDVIDLFVLIIHEQKVSLARRFALVPLGPPLLTYKSNCKAMLTAEGDSVRLVVDRPYKAGEPIIVWYYVLFSCIKFVFFLMLFCNLNSDQLVQILCFLVHVFKNLKLCRLCRCGPQTNSRLVLNYGFVDEDNPFDRITIEVNNLYSSQFFFFVPLV